MRRRPPSGSTGSPGRRFGRQIRSGTCSWSGTVLKVEAPPVDVVAIVASAGGIAPIERVLGSLPAGLNAAVLVLLHLTPLHPSLLPTILARKTMLRVKSAEDGDALEAGTVYVAPPDAHLRVDGAHLRLDRVTGVVHHVRPSADVLLESLAERNSTHCVAVVLSGTGVDGAEGAAVLRRAGGTVLAQSE
ncbi:MAG: chemotaxis protein CheB, partial [Actinobacteria bacterium]|nr:chemotaxis protein CheB [Actinomycetota bacterium]